MRENRGWEWILEEKENNWICRMNKEGSGRSKDDIKKNARKNEKASGQKKKRSGRMEEERQSNVKFKIFSI